MTPPCAPSLIVALSAAITVVNVGVIVAAAVIVRRGKRTAQEIAKAVHLMYELKIREFQSVRCRCGLDP
jgi:hypothetical protein